MLEVLLDTLKDSIRLVPFLLVAYIIMEYIEHKTSDKTKDIIQKSGKFGPFLGSLVGIFPQCGFSAMAANLYAGRIITLGTLIAIFLSTSDEMLPILISEAAPIDTILKILAVKLVIGIIAGFVIDVVLRKITKHEKENKISEVCEHEHCHCEEEGVLKSSLKHTASVFIYIFIISLILNVVIYFVGEDNLANLILNKPILGSVIAGLIGLIPNCASSVLLTKLYLSEVINVSTMIAGLLVGAGVGILVLCKVNKNAKENAKIITLLYAIGVISGILLEFIGIKF
ncbi:MAG: arsenic efflux protein [Clostridia bacterium]|nr:arsenic efflux protein [Clostridia bacterium]